MLVKLTPGLLKEAFFLLNILKNLKKERSYRKHWKMSDKNGKKSSLVGRKIWAEGDKLQKENIEFKERKVNKV